MIGEQTIELNEATVKKALEEFLNRELVHKIEITEWRHNGNGYGAKNIAVQFQPQTIVSAGRTELQGDPNENSAQDDRPRDPRVSSLPTPS